MSLAGWYVIKERKRFFFEKKKQKTFAPGGRSHAPCKSYKSLLELFFQKSDLFLILLSLATVP